jgi:hypothetical protein
MKNTCIRCLALKYEKFVGKIRCSYEMHSFHFTILFVKCWWVKHWDIKWRGLSSIWYDICILPLDKPCLIILKKKKTCLEARASRGFLLKCVFDLLHPVPPSAVGIHADVIVVLSRLKEQETFVPILPFPYLGLVTGRGPRAVSGPFSALF